MTFICEEIVPPKAIKTRAPLPARFWRKVDMAGSCWIWRGAINNKGYGFINVGGRAGGPMLAHRVSWEINRGLVPDDKIVMHSCDNPPCVNPDHLCLGTRRENQKDMFDKGRGGGQFVRDESRQRIVQDAAYYRAYYAKRKAQRLKQGGSS